VTITNAVADAVRRNVRLSIWTATNCQALWTKAVARVPSLMPTTAARNTRRRPSRSMKGITKRAGMAPRRTSAVRRPTSDCGGRSPVMY
jgi:hypothetical protein